MPAHASDFDTFLRNIQVSRKQIEACRRAAIEVNGHLMSDPETQPVIITTFLQGSARRGTHVRPLHDQRSDVDLVVATFLDEVEHSPPAKAWERFAPFLERVYGPRDGRWRAQDRSVRLLFPNPDPDLQVELDLLAPPDGLVPARTRWYLVSATERGDGELELHPASWTGLPRTFQHQAWSVPLGRDVPWMSGKICPRSSAGAQRLLTSAEPDAFPSRAVWLVEAGLRWLHAASSGALAPPGADLELPPLPPTVDLVVAFHERPADLRHWTAQTGRHGLAEVAVVNPRGLAAARSRGGVGSTTRGGPPLMAWGAGL